MKDCRFCVQWVDENLEDIVASEGVDTAPHLFFGCKIYGNIEDWKTRANTCADYQESADLYAMCSSCQIVVPKLCISMGVCVNCLNRDLFCVEQCIGGELNKYCTHFVRLQREGIQLIVNNVVSNLFPEPPKPRPRAEKPVKNKSTSDDNV